MAKVKEKATEVVAKATEAVVKATKAAASAPVEEKTAEAKAVEAKVEKAKKTTTKKAATEKKPAAKKTAAKSTEIFVQYHNQQQTTDYIVESIKAQYAAEGNKASAIKSLKVYIKPEDGVAYYVINDTTAGSVSLF